MIPSRIAGRMAEAAPQFHSNDAWTLLSCDADSLIYKVAATTNSIETAKRRFVDRALTLHFLADADTTTLHLTPKHCTKAGRNNILAVKPYQGNRANAKKPALVEPLRYAVGRGQLLLPPELTLVFNDLYEADDSLVMECFQFGKSAIYFSEDKDLDKLRNRKLCQYEMTVLPEVPLSSVGTLDLKQLSASKKVVGRGPLFFWAQMLMGDSADNIKGIQRVNGTLCGPSKTFDLLNPYVGTSDELKVAQFVLGLYKEINQNPWPEGWLLYLYEKDKFNFYQYCNRLGLIDNSELGIWLKQQLKLNWFVKSEE